MALVGDTLYVASADAVVRFPYAPGQTQITAPAVTVLDLPAGAINQHWTRSLIAAPDGSRLYVGVGSASNAAEHGMEEEEGRAAIWEVDPRTGSYRIFASGLRNPVGMAWEPETGALWVAVNERDELGGDLVPDYMTAVRDGGFYGWPYSYFGSIVDLRVKPQRLDLVRSAIMPDYALGAHTASLGLAHSRGSMLPPPFREGMFVGQHGSWNRKPRSGYKVIFVPFAEGKPCGPPIDVLTGFVTEDGRAMGRPAIDTRGALLVTDDVGNTIWRVAATPARRHGRRLARRGPAHHGDRVCADLNTSVVLLHKTRETGTETRVTHLVGDVGGRPCLFVDDMISTGGTIAEAVDKLLEMGARPGIAVAATHGGTVEPPSHRIGGPAIGRSHPSCHVCGGRPPGE